MIRRFALVLAAIAAALAAPLAAQDFPARPDGPVYDGADIIPPAEEARLDSRLRQYNAETGRAIIVATVPSLEGNPVDMYAQQLAETWDVSGKETEEGVVMVVAPNDREAWITTARGVQTTLTDAMAGRIFRNAMVPRFKAGDYPGGIEAGVNGIIETLNMDPASAKAIEEAEKAAARNSKGADPSGIVFWIFMIAVFALLFGRRGRYRRRRYGVAGAVGDIILWNAISHAAGGRHHSGGFGGGGGGGFGGFGGGGGGFNGGGAGGSW